MKIILANVIAIYRRELQSYFASPFAYVIAGIFWLLSGFFFFFILMGADGLLAQVALRDQMGITTPPVDVAYQLLSTFLGVLAFPLAWFILPLLSMGMYTEERKRGTLELLATSPITNWAVALGKLLGALTFFVTLLLPLLVYEAIALTAASPPVSLTLWLIGHVGLVLLAAAILALGMFLSSLTDSTILAAVMTYGILVLLWLTDIIGNSIGGAVGAAVSHLSLLKSYSNLTQGIFQLSDLVLFISYIVLGLFLTAQTIEAFRFQRS